MIFRGFRYKLAPTAEQESLFRQFAGVCRLVYNIALEQRRDWYRQYETNTGRRLTYVAQARELTALRSEYDWIAAVSQTCQQQALRDLDKAYGNFSKDIARYPTPRRKGVNDTFRFQGREVEVRKLNGKWSALRLPKIGWVKFPDTRPCAARSGTSPSLSMRSAGTSPSPVRLSRPSRPISVRASASIAVWRSR